MEVLFWFFGLNFICKILNHSVQNVSKYHQQGSETKKKRCRINDDGGDGGYDDDSNKKAAEAAHISYENSWNFKATD